MKSKKTKNDHGGIVDDYHCDIFHDVWTSSLNNSVIMILIVDNHDCDVFAWTFSLNNASDQVDGKREYDCRVLLRADAVQRLKWVRVYELMIWFIMMMIIQIVMVIEIDG